MGRNDDMDRIDEGELDRIERDHARGLTSAEILGILASHGLKFSEATLRKYVQLGLLPRSIRVGRKGKHQGSQGLYPATVVRQICEIKRLMASDKTIEDIQRELFVRGEIEELSRIFSKILVTLREATKGRRSDTVSRGLTSDVAQVEALGKELVERLETIERRLTAESKIERQVAV